MIRFLSSMLLCIMLVTPVMAEEASLQEQREALRETLAKYEHMIELETIRLENFNLRSALIDVQLQQIQVQAEQVAKNIEITTNNIKKLEQAIADLSRVIELTPEDTDAIYNRGLAYTEQGDLEEAVVLAATEQQDGLAPPLPVPWVCLTDVDPACRDVSAARNYRDQQDQPGR